MSEKEKKLTHDWTEDPEWTKEDLDLVLAWIQIIEEDGGSIYPNKKLDVSQVTELTPPHLP